MSDRIAIDIGGTFTDYVAIDNSTAAVIHTKTLTDPETLVESFADALPQVGTTLDEVELLLHATTTVTNLIIERRGTKVGLITTKGFRDILEIGWSARGPEQPYSLQVPKTLPFVARPFCLEVAERIGPDGDERIPLDEDAVRAAARTLVQRDVGAIAIGFLHSYANRAHEERARQLVGAEAPGVPCVIASEVDPRIGEYERISTGVLNAYALPHMARYIDGLEAWLPSDASAYFMLSEGGVAPSSYARANPIALIASGPTAGVLAACFVGKAAGLHNLITFDVGGTSCDVCVVRSGQAAQKDLLTIDNDSIPIRTQCVDVVSIGAGGGSIAWVDEGSALRVGPHSAGASPGPACYGLGGDSATVTDANVVLGLVDATNFLGGRLKADPAAAHRVVARLADSLGVGAEDAALAIYRIVNANMAQAIRTITVQKGIDPRDFTLVAFGGAGGQHAVNVAREMQIRSVLFPPHPSAFSALGLLTADLRITRVRPAVKMLEGVQTADANSEFAALEAEISEAFARTGRVTETLIVQRFADLRYLGQIHTIQVPLETWSPDEIAQRFEGLHEIRFGTRLGDPIEVVNLGLTGAIQLPKPSLEAKGSGDGTGELNVIRSSRVLTEGVDVPVIMRSSVASGTTLPSPSLIQEVDSVLYLPSGTRATMGDFGNIFCEL